MKLTARFPAGPPATVDEVLSAVDGGRLTVGDPRIVDFLHGFARRLLAPAVARRHPELGSLGFFLRRAEVDRALHRLRSGVGDALAFPRGLVFHIPPANVDTIFVYSWALAALAGNANIVRISTRSAVAADTVLEALNAALADADPVVAQTQRMVSYGHDDAVTARLSAACDVRVVWGGDRAVNELRRHPLAPAARDLTFPDRASFAAISVAGWLAAGDGARRDAAERFANDVYWFDQAACASPRAVFLVGDQTAASAVRDEFVGLLAEAVRAKGWDVDAAMAVEKRVGAYGVAADGDATALGFVGNEIATLELTTPAVAPRRWLGAGTLPFATVAALTDLVPMIRRKDQTFSQFGFARAELVEFAQALGGRGIDRMVPFGSALSFAAVWDGYDLLREFCRLVTVDA
jgi:Acyl-CoA reductase (LuxC)